MSVYLSGDLPRTWTKATWKFYSWLVRKTWRDNKAEFEKVWLDQLTFGEGYWKLKDGYAEHVPITDILADQPS